MPSKLIQPEQIPQFNVPVEHVPPPFEQLPHACPHGVELHPDVSHVPHPGGGVAVGSGVGVGSPGGGI